MKITNFEKKKMIPLTIKWQELHENTKICYIYLKFFFCKYTYNKNYRNVGDHCHFTGNYKSVAHDKYNLKDTLKIIKNTLKHFCGF